MAEYRYKTNLGKALANLSKDLNVINGLASVNGELDANEKFDIFRSAGIRRKEGLANNAVSVSYEKPDLGVGYSYLGKYNPYGSTLYSELNDNKAGRLYEYRLMAAYSEVANCIDHICNEFISVVDGNVATLNYLKPSKTPVEETTLIEEFNYFTRLFEFENKGYSYCWRYLVEGELFLEHIINNANENNIKEGILGVLDIPSELIDAVWKSKQAGIIDCFIGRKPIYAETGNERRIEKIEIVPYEANQIFYVNSGLWDPEGEYLVPFIERGRRRYIQLSYIEDAIVIYRLARAPERLVFTIPTGNLSPGDAAAYITNIKNQHWKAKIMDINTQDITQKYNPQSMTDAYYFSKPQNGEAISVQTLKGADNLGELRDLEFFLRALYRDLKIPSSYLNYAEKQQNTEPGQILVEELRFADLIISIQRKFATALKQSFITHLKFKGLWQRFSMHENHLHIQFNQPSHYYLMRELQLTNMRTEIVNSLSSNELISKIYALKKYFNWSDKEILANIKFLKVESELIWEIAQRKESGPTWKNQLLSTGMGDEGGVGGEGMPMGMDIGGENMPPDFGGGPAAETGGGGEEIEEPTEEGPGDEIQPV